MVRAAVLWPIHTVARYGIRGPVRPREPPANAGIGVLVITPDYRFTIIETADGRKAATTTEEFAALQRSELAFSGLATFSPDPNNPNGLKMVSNVDIAWNAEWVGTLQTRFLTLDGNRLTIRTEPHKNPHNGELAISTLVFERAR